MIAEMTMRSDGAICDHFGDCRKPVALDYDLPLCNPNGTLPCLNKDGNVVATKAGGEVVLSKRLWWTALWSPVRASYGAVMAWKKFADHCYDCPPDENGCYGAWGCVSTSLSTVASTAWAMWQWGLFVAAVAKRDEDSVRGFVHQLGPLLVDTTNSSTIYKRDGSVSFHNVTAFIDGQPKFLLDMAYIDGTSTVSLNHHPAALANGALTKRSYQDKDHQHADGAGIKLTYCPHHPEHHLNVQNDWNDIWSQENNMLGSYMDYYDNDIGAVDLNDVVSGGWKLLMSSGQLVIEETDTFGWNPETCEYNVFDGLAR